MEEEVTFPAPGLTWDGMRAALIDRIWRGVLVMGLIGPMTSVARIEITGWKPIYLFQIVVSGSIVTAFWLRQRLPLTFRAVVPVATGLVLGLTGMVNFGFVGNGPAFLLLGCLVLGMLFTLWISVLVSIVVALVVVVTATAFITGYLSANFDANIALRDAWFWVNFLGIFIFVIFMQSAIAGYMDSVRGLLLEVQRQRDIIARQATHDQLTGLPTLRLSFDRLEIALNQARRQGAKVGLMFIDLDGFKQANDTHGHEAGDRILQEVALRLRQTARANDTVARIGGDEFLVILTAIPDSEVAAQVARKIIAAVGAPVPFRELGLIVGCSIGISLFPDHAQDPHELRRHADAAMYSVKRSRKNSFAFFAPAQVPGQAMPFD